MSLANYFENVKGTGILGTADLEGKVDLAIYARPQVIDEETVAFIMEDYLSHGNVAANPHAAYLFLENAEECHREERSTPAPAQAGKAISVPGRGDCLATLAMTR